MKKRTMKEDLICRFGKLITIKKHNGVFKQEQYRLRNCFITSFALEKLMKDYRVYLSSLNYLVVSKRH